MKPIASFRLFGEEKLGEYWNKKSWEIKARIDDVDAQVIALTDPDDFMQTIVDEFRLTLPILDFQNVQISSYDKSVRASEVPDQFRAPFHDTIHAKYRLETVVYYIPVTGDITLLKLQPTNVRPPFHQAYLTADSLAFEIANYDNNVQRLRNEGTTTLERIESQFREFTKELEACNGDLTSIVKKLYEKRYGRVTGADPLLATIGLPIKKRSDVPASYLVPTEQKSLELIQRKFGTGNAPSDPNISVSDYEEILGILTTMAIAMERSPRTFSKLKEEEIRDFFLIYLNGYFEGQATGETFNYGGDTDILVRVANKNVFIGECKFWRGEVGFAETIDQLLGYTGWRDRKTSILLFNTNRNLSSVLKKVDAVVTSHESFKRRNKLTHPSLQNETINSYVVHQPNDKSVDIILTVLAFNIPLTPE